MEEALAKEDKEFVTLKIKKSDWTTRCLEKSPNRCKLPTRLSFNPIPPFASLPFLPFIPQF